MDEFRVWIKTQFRDGNGIASYFLCFYILIHSLNNSWVPSQSTVCKEELSIFHLLVLSNQSEKKLVICLPNLVFFLCLFILIYKSDEDDEEPVVDLLIPRNIFSEYISHSAFIFIHSLLFWGIQSSKELNIWHVFYMRVQEMVQGKLCHWRTC